MTKGTKKCGTTLSNTLQGSNDVANSRDSTESGMEMWCGIVGCDGGMGQITDFEDLNS